MKPDFEIKTVRLFNCDCMEFMKEIPDNYYELAIVDPPYTNDYKNMKNMNQDMIGKMAKVGVYHYNTLTNSKPSPEYWGELFRISKNYIVWGANYFIESLKSTPCVIVWDKNNSGNFADCEIAFGSFKKSAKIFKHTWNGMLQQNMKEKESRIHPTQKPVQLYKWLLTNYAKKGDKIFDSHGGSFSSACACLDMGFQFDGCEIDKEYFDNAVERLKNNVQEYLNF